MASSSRFVRHLKWWFLVLPVLVCVCLPVVPMQSLFEISEIESRSVVRALGDERASAAVDTTNRLFHRFFIDTGAVQATMSTGESSDLDDDGMSSFAHTWVKQFWMLLYRALYRAVVMHAWLGGLVVLCFAAAMDGSVRRKIRAAAAGFASPLSFHLAVHALLLTLGCAFAVLLLPLPIVAQCWTAVAVLLPLLLWIASSSS
ncbi:hypothetical protein F4827_006373 [Paraburkholderia bannensis]|uniref:DUF4400 domain-containing protein n=1 Tax=Paraburkholderia bannensis TaxID=765414 RepID=A0A7W9WWV2_9BURK|nr:MULTISPECIES: DUF4400 domain-containing protein [Paraburkholderia]MBB3262393.1 hypothetical protein [Paraburkholderia sp. WP4_3_2]MBB6106498.1 hypothetical protein [Paraburkholderia bannensis]